MDNLCATVDLNRLQISGKTTEVMCNDDLGEKFAAFGWHVINVQDGNDCALLLQAYQKAADYKGKPSVVIAHTVKGKGVSYMENQKGWHHGVMTEEQYETSNQRNRGGVSMSHITNRQAICDTLVEAARTDKDIVVACSDSRGSASLAPFAVAYPKQFVELGIAEQNLVTVSAGLAACGKKVFAASPASFLSTRSYEQAKVDVAYSNTNVTLIGISGGVSYGALGMTHHSCQDIAAMACLPDMRVYLPSDRYQTANLIQALLQDDKPGICTCQPICY